MDQKRVFGMMLVLLLANLLLITLDVPVVFASGTIYIKADGTVDPPTAPIQRTGDIYTFTGNITEPIVIEKDNIVVDGAGYTIQGAGSDHGLLLNWGKSNVTIKNMKIENFYSGICLGFHSRNNSIFGNTMTRTDVGIFIHSSSNNSVYGNTLTGIFNGIWLYSPCDNNSVSGNTVTGSYISIRLESSSNNSISGNTITNSTRYGIYLAYSSNNNSVSGNTITNSTKAGIYLETSSGNSIYHNNFILNTPQVGSRNSVNTWDDGFPSGGNYWWDHNVTDLYSGPYQNVTGSDGIGDTPYIINADNQDRYPQIKPITARGLDWTLVAIIVAIATVGTITVAIFLRRIRKRPPTAPPKVSPPPPPPRT